MFAQEVAEQAGLEAELLTVPHLLGIWWTVAAMLVLLMQLGFICLEMGCVRECSRAGIAVKNFMMLLVASIVFTLIGVHLMYGESAGGWIGVKAAELHFDSYGWLFFQAGFAAVAATILSGALAGRTTLLSNVLLAIVMALVIYPVFGHWVWNEHGWLAELKARDFAGSGAVHFIGGFTALLACRFAGPRRGFFNDKGEVQDLGPRSLPFATVAVVLLWVGWIGFNGGSVLPSHFKLEDGGLSADQGFRVIGSAILATCCAASGGGLCAMFGAAHYHWRRGRAKGLKLREAFRQKLLFDPWATLGGTMGGMVAITANCDWLEEAFPGAFLWVALVFGIVGGAASFWTAFLVKEILGIDDPVEAIAVHAGGGAVGVLLAGFENPSLEGFGVQILMLAAAVSWVMIVALPCLWVLSKCKLLRASVVEEELGLTFESFESSVITGEMIKEHSGSWTGSETRTPDPS